MRIIADFKCEENHINELWCDFHDKDATCPDCSKPAKRIISALNFSLDPTKASHYPTAGDRWVKDRERKIMKERRDAANHGPDHYEHKVREV